MNLLLHDNLFFFFYNVLFLQSDYRWPYRGPMAKMHTINAACMPSTIHNCWVMALQWLTPVGPQSLVTMAGSSHLPMCHIAPLLLMYVTMFSSLHKDTHTFYISTTTQCSWFFFHSMSFIIAAQLGVRECDKASISPSVFLRWGHCWWTALRLGGRSFRPDSGSGWLQSCRLCGWRRDGILIRLLDIHHLSILPGICIW